jgi:hypothetical protein
MNYPRFYIVIKKGYRNLILCLNNEYFPRKLATITKTDYSSWNLNPIPMSEKCYKYLKE